MNQPPYGTPPPPPVPPTASPGYGQPVPPTAPTGYGPSVPHPGYGQPVPPTAPMGFGPPPPSYAPHPAPADAPEFLAVDRRNSVVVDETGVTFECNGVTAEFPWPEIRSVHYQPSGNGKSLMVAVIHADGILYECVVDAKRGERLHEWLSQLALVIGHYRYYRPGG
ncbi:hypothetical protein ABZ612_37510 [Streptomyces avermitilis]|uniref:hypothetical protein n=1 Tax=Streptomyces avermitilis TaxID=33903 RepID=UPI00340A07AB